MRICWRCNDNLSFTGVVPVEFLDEEGAKPCCECIQEMAEEQDNEESECG